MMYEGSIRQALEEKYNKTKFEITMLETKLNIINDDYDTSITPAYSNLPTGKGNTSDKVFDAVEKREAKKMKLEKQIAEKKKYINLLDNLISTQKNSVQMLVRKRAIEKKSYTTIADELYNFGISNSTYCRELYGKAMKSMQNIYEGIMNDEK